MGEGLDMLLPTISAYDINNRKVINNFILHILMMPHLLFSILHISNFRDIRLVLLFYFLISNNILMQLNKNCTISEKIKFHHTFFISILSLFK